VLAKKKKKKTYEERVSQRKHGDAVHAAARGRVTWRMREHSDAARAGAETTRGVASQSRSVVGPGGSLRERVAVSIGKEGRVCSDLAAKEEVSKKK